MIDISGKKDAKFIKERYQHELNDAYGRVNKQISLLFDMNHKLKWPLSQVEKLERDMEADQTHRAELYTSLQNILMKETTFEKEMWKETQKGRKVKSVTIKQKFKDSDIDEVRYDSMMDYLKKYPEYTSKTGFSTILESIHRVEEGIKRTKKEYHRMITDAKREIAYFPSNIMNARNRIATYKKILAEGQEKLNKMRFKKGLLYKLSSETTRLQVNLDTLNHKINEKEDIIDRMEAEVNLADAELKKLSARSPA